MNLTAANKAKLASKQWRMHNLYKIVNKQGQLVVFKPNAEQDAFMRTRSLRSIILKARQLGFTTLACIDFLDDCLWTKNMNAVIIAHKLDQLEVIFSKVLLAWENFSKDYGKSLGFWVDTDRANMLKFNTGSKIRVALSSRGDMVNRLHVSEFGKICAMYPKKAEEILTGAFPSVPKGGRIVIESTAEGETGLFHDMFWDAWNNEADKKSDLDFAAYFYPWHLRDEYTESNDSIKIPPRPTQIPESPQPKRRPDQMVLHDVEDAEEKDETGIPFNPRRSIRE